MKLKRLSNQGLEAMRQFLDDVRNRRVQEVPRELLMGQENTIDILGSPVIEHRQFGSRFQFVTWVADLLEISEQPELARDEGFWAWLSLFLFDEVCPKGKSGFRFVGADWRHIPSFEDWRHFYRHLLAGPYSLLQAQVEDPTRAMALLVQPLASPGDFVEQIASRRELATSAAVVGAATILYLNRAKGKLKTGAGDKGAGGGRRFAAVVGQFDCTYDLYTLSPEELIAILPEEFDKFK